MRVIPIGSQNILRILITLLALLPFAKGISATAAIAAAHPIVELRQLMQAAVTAKTNRVVIPPGIYRGVPKPGERVLVELRNAAGLEIIADGVTMICEHPTRAMNISRCTNVTLRGLTIDYDPLPFTQGEIVTVNPAEGWLDVKIHAGYPVEPYTRLDIVDRQTRYRKQDKPFMWGGKAEVRPGGIVRVQNRSAAAFAQVGDLASMGGYGNNVVPHTLAVEDSGNITLQNVTVFTSNCMGIIASGGEGNHRFLGCRVVPGPPPPGATEPRILSTEADAILTSSLRQGVLTEGCEIRDAGDDSWSVQSSDYVIVKREGRTLLLAARDTMAVQSGDRLQASLNGPVARVVSRTVLKRKDAALSPAIEQHLAKSGPWGYWHLLPAFPGGNVCQVTVDAEVPWQEGDSVYDLDRQGNGFIFRNNTVRSSGRILIKASGLVESNRIEGPFAISVLPEVPHQAAAGIDEIVIRHNLIREAHMFNPFPDSPQAGAISVMGGDDGHGGLRPAGVHGRVIIENNTIEGGNGAGIVISSARDVTIRSNRLVRLLHMPPNSTGKRYRIDNHAAVWLAQCDHVLLQDNQLLAPGPELSQPVVQGPGVKQVEGALTISPTH
ncbi:MAG: right-handed parallel beta-helix repeat-containing protein [Verrucomicrobiota bacterium]